MRKKTEDYTIKELIEMGAIVDIYFHENGDLQKAYNKLKPFTDISSIQKWRRGETVWVKVGNKKVDVNAFL